MHGNAFSKRQANEAGPLNLSLAFSQTFKGHIALRKKVISAAGGGCRAKFFSFPLAPASLIHNRDDGMSGVRASYSIFWQGVETSEGGGLICICRPLSFTVSAGCPFNSGHRKSDTIHTEACHM